MQKENKILVWDLPVRLFHWLLVGAIVAQWVTAELLDDAMDWHFYIGYFTLGLILFRLIWGFVGPRYSRFSQFLVSPKAYWQYLKSLRNPQKHHYVGHNPLGGLLVPLVIIVIGIQTVSGLFATDDVLHSGPYISMVSAEVQALLNEIHHTTFDIITVIIVVHLVAILWHKFIAKHHIIKAMFTGKKQGEYNSGISSSNVLLAVLIAACIGAAIYALIALAPVPEAFYF
ncbi:cytochrome b/b6 domain-containing protein [Aliiglaciecola litoralis]|uniref:Cytochrome b/b6 domain-containing protein n=1 Tax=Aliiglaciecola litoralis TaxID=582857 RepID=A0ABN1LEC6_9ALTE